MTTIALSFHILGAVIWVGGMFTIYVCLRPALGSLDAAPASLRLMRAVFAEFFPWVWVSILVLFTSGYLVLFTVQGGFAFAGTHVHIMQAIAWIMALLFAWLYRGPWADFREAADAADWARAGADLGRIRRIIAVNLPLGLIAAVVGASGRWWT